MASFQRFRFQKKYMAFLAIVPLLVVTALVNVDCPVCHGQGSVNSLPAMENVQIVESESKEKYVTRDACGIYILYQYEVVLSLVNEGPDVAEGWLRMTLKDTLNDRVVDEQYVAIEIPGETLLDATYTVWFGTGLDQPGQTKVDVEVVVGAVPDMVCNGTGKIPLNTLFFVNSLKDTFDDIVRVEQAYKPPKSIDWGSFTFFDY